MFCGQSGLSTSEEQLCYSLETTKAQVAAWVALGMETRRVCARLDSMTGRETCALRPGAPPPERRRLPREGIIYV